MKPARRRDPIFTEKRGLLFLGCVVLAFIQAGLYAGHRNSHPNYYPDDPSSSARSKWSSPSSSEKTSEHPITKLVADAEESYRKLLAKQSRTLRQAATQYKQRYHRNPPKGFDEWYKFATDNGFKLVDEFDAIAEDLAPFWELSGKEFRERALLAGHLPSVDLVRMRRGNSSAVNVYDENQDVSARAVGFQEMIAKFEHSLPDMDFPINARPDGRILIPWEHRKYPNMTEQDASRGLEAMLGGPVIPDWRGEGNVWSVFRRTCDPSSAARRLYSSYRDVFTPQSRQYLPSSATGPAASPEFEFARETDAGWDYCTRPWAHFSQGHFFADWRSVPTLLPVFSPGKAPGFMDIRVPSRYYYGSTPRYTYGWDAVNLELKAVDPNDVPWEDKDGRIFWRGASTGGGSAPQGFSAQYQRHRFVRLASDESDTNRTVTYAAPPSSRHYTSTPVPVRDLNADVMDVAFVSAPDGWNYPGGEDAMRQELRFAEPVSLGRWWNYKYLMDLDGNGYSGRFMAYMASDSAVMKSTVYKEYFHDWIQPWLHFIPVSSSYKEIYNIHAYFSGASDATLQAANSPVLSLPPEQRRSLEGDRRLRRIARAGKNWKKTVGRQVDMEVYVYRLCLEYARLWADDRDAMSYKA